MKQFLFLSSLILGIMGCSHTSNQMDDLEVLRTEIQQAFSEVEGDFGLAFKYLGNDNHSLYINERENFHAASTMKTPVMIEVYKQAAAGKFMLTDSILVHNEFKSIIDGSPYSMELGVDSEEELYHQIGNKTTIYDIVYPMITRSSNLATNILIDMVGAENTTNTMRDLGAKDIQVLRGVEDQKAYDAGKNNTTTAYDLLVIMEAIATQTAVDPHADQEMFKVLADQHFRDLIPADLPEEITVAHKTGFITGVQHDSGIVRLPDGRQYVLVILSKNLNDSTQGKQVIAKVSRKIYDYINSLSS
ncbi:serine hydrolase [Anditalea andensis]|uniref:beta-lactamase n=1 Tax=Anditalea andensis TaxID=1048983 RepID=A0A074LF54_9BACT|nr:serine hydrolase [Anditalea andensis]KEO72422.1 beta-lactamase [Anditalea andensis]